MGSQNGTPPDDAPAKAEDGAADRPAIPSIVAGARPSTPPEQSSIGGSSVSAQENEPKRPPLPPRPSTSIDLVTRPSRSRSSTLQLPRRTSRAQLAAGATTALSLADVQSHAYSGGTRETYSHSVRSTPSRKSLRTASPTGNQRSYQGSDADDSTSILSSVPRGGIGIDAESILGDVLVVDQAPTSGGFDGPSQNVLMGMVPYDMSEPTADFSREFDELGEMEADGSNEGDHARPGLHP